MKASYWIALSTLLVGCARNSTDSTRLEETAKAGESTSAERPDPAGDNRLFWEGTITVVTRKKTSDSRIYGSLKTLKSTGESQKEYLDTYVLSSKDPRNRYYPELPMWDVYGDWQGKYHHFVGGKSWEKPYKKGGGWGPFREKGGSQSTEEGSGRSELCLEIDLRHKGEYSMKIFPERHNLEGKTNIFLRTWYFVDPGEPGKSGETTSTESGKFSYAARLTKNSAGDPWFDLEKIIEDKLDPHNHDILQGATSITVPSHKVEGLEDFSHIVNEQTVTWFLFRRPSGKFIQVWINAFIPMDAPDYITVGAGPFRGKTAVPTPIPLPSFMPLPTYNPYAPFMYLTTYYFLTDQRGFTNDINQGRFQSAIHSWMLIDLSGDTPRLSQWHNTHTTVQMLDQVFSFQPICEKRTDLARVRFEAMELTKEKIVVRYKAAANDPCIKGTPDVDIEGEIIIAPQAGTVTFDGKVDNYPSFEMYASLNGAEGAKLFQIGPAGGVLSLYGAAKRPVKGECTLR